MTTWREIVSEFSTPLREVVTACFTRAEQLGGLGALRIFMGACAWAGPRFRPMEQRISEYVTRQHAMCRAGDWQRLASHLASGRSHLLRYLAVHLRGIGYDMVFSVTLRGMLREKRMIARDILDEIWPDLRRGESRKEVVRRRGDAILFVHTCDGEIEIKGRTYTIPFRVLQWGDGTFERISFEVQFLSKKLHRGLRHCAHDAEALLEQCEQIRDRIRCLEDTAVQPVPRATKHALRLVREIQDSPLRGVNHLPCVLKRPKLPPLFVEETIWPPQQTRGVADVKAWCLSDEGRRLLDPHSAEWDCPEEPIAHQEECAEAEPRPTVEGFCSPASSPIRRSSSKTCRYFPQVPLSS